jgi:hypothetical protein
MASGLAADAFRRGGNRKRSKQAIALEDVQELIVDGYFKTEIGSHGGLRTSKAL